MLKCIARFNEPLMSPRFQKKHPPTMHVQLDNYARDNKNIFVFTYWSFLVSKDISNKVIVSFLLVDHTHNDIDASFGRWSRKLHKDFPTISLLMKLYMDLDNVPIISHIIKDESYFKSFIKLYFWSGGVSCFIFVHLQLVMGNAYLKL